LTRKDILHKGSAVILRGAVLLCMLLAAGILYARMAGYELLSVQSDSMKPIMRTGDAVLLSKSDTDLTPGDVVSYASAENPRVVITHRVIGVDNKRGIISTKGDDTPLVDQPVPAWNVMGTVTHVIPALGFALNILKHPLGLLAVIYLPAATIVIAEIRRLSLYYATGISGGRRVRYKLTKLNYQRS
jgi:signal peptidase I